MSADGTRLTPLNAPVVQLDIEFPSGLFELPDHSADVIDLAEYRRRLDLRCREVPFQ